MFLATLLLMAAIENPMLVSTDWMAGHLDDPLVVVVEVGDQAQYAAGHIPGARFVPREAIVADRDGLPNEIPSEETLVAAFARAGVGNSKRIVLYSRDPLIAARTWFTLDAIGHGPRASLLDGGINKWNAENRPLSTASVQVDEKPFTIDPRAHSVIKYAELRGLISRRSSTDVPLVTIDARPSLYFTGDLRGQGITRPGHIPDAVSIPWTTNLTTGDTPVLRSVEELRQLYTSAGVTRDSMVVTYCRTGMEASMTYFVLRYLGYDATLYDGSFIEWSNENAPVVASQ